MIHTYLMYDSYIPYVWFIHNVWFEGAVDQL